MATAQAEASEAGPVSSHSRSSRIKRLVRAALVIGLVLLIGEQTWRHGHDYVLPKNFAEVEPGVIYRGAWQKDWPMRRLVRDYGVKTIVALAHPADHPLAIREQALAQELGVRWIHLPIVEDLSVTGGATISEQVDRAVEAISNPENQPVFFHCHHGLNRASMVQIAYRIKKQGWTLEQAYQEIDRVFGLVVVSRGPDYRMMKAYAEGLITSSQAAPEVDERRR